MDDLKPDNKTKQNKQQKLNNKILIFFVLVHTSHSARCAREEAKLARAYPSQEQRQSCV